jgi:hypothetical protein
MVLSESRWCCQSQDAHNDLDSDSDPETGYLHLYLFAIFDYLFIKINNLVTLKGVRVRVKVRVKM